MDIEDAVIELCCELALDAINATDDEDEQERLIESAESRAVDILNCGDAEAFLREHGAG